MKYRQNREVPHGNPYGCLDGIHDEGTLDGAQALDGPQHVDAEFVVVLHVGGIYQSTIRLSIGTEHIDDIIEDLSQAFDQI